MNKSCLSFSSSISPRNGEESKFLDQGDNAKNTPDSYFRTADRDYEAIALVSRQIRRYIYARDNIKQALENRIKENQSRQKGISRRRINIRGGGAKKKYHGPWSCATPAFLIFLGSWKGRETQKIIFGSGFSNLRVLELSKFF